MEKSLGIPIPRGESELPAAPPGWLESAIPRLTEAAMELSRATSADETMRLTVEIARERFGFSRIGSWFFEDGGASAVGSYGVDADGRLCDERGKRIFDRTGFLSHMAEVWKLPPYYFSKPRDELRSAEAKLVGYGSHVTAPMIYNGECCGFVAVDDLIPSDSVHDQTGYFLSQYALLVAGIYFQKKAEDRVRLAEEACAHAERAKAEFLGMMSHEVRTPLNAIMGYAQLLAMDPSHGDTLTLARTIETSSEHLLELINGILEFSQLSGTDLKSWYKPCDLVETARSVAESFDHLYRQKGLALEFAHEGDTQGLVNADAVSFRQVLANLLQNALKFTSSGKARLGLQTMARQSGMTEFFVTVEDTGIGIAPERLREIFLPFKQLDSSLTRKAGGIGLGLSIVERLVAGMGGKLECRSEPGSGTTFSLDFVFANAERTTAPQEGPGTVQRVVRPNHDLRLLAVEDNEENLKVLLAMLDRLGYPPPETAADGRAAKRLLRRKPFDIALLDVEMPEIDGLALTRDIRAGRCGPINRDVAIVGITAFTMEHDREECLIAGMDEYLAKPVRISALRDALRRV